MGYRNIYTKFSDVWEFTHIFLATIFWDHKKKKSLGYNVMKCQVYLYLRPQTFISCLADTFICWRVLGFGDHLHGSKLQTLSLLSPDQGEVFTAWHRHIFSCFWKTKILMFLICMATRRPVQTLWAVNEQIKVHSSSQFHHSYTTYMSCSWDAAHRLFIDRKTKVVLHFQRLCSLRVRQHDKVFTISALSVMNVNIWLVYEW